MDYKIVVDAGHGGDDPGASGNGIVEKDLNLKIAQYMNQRFKDLQIPVKMTRTTDETLTHEERVKRILDAYGNSSNVIVLANHINAGGGEGAEVVYALRNKDTLARSILEEIGKEGQIMRKYYQRRLPTDPTLDYYFIQRETGVTQPLLIEYGFLDTSSDATRLKNNYTKYAEAVVRAVAKYINKPYQSPSGIAENTYTVQSGDSLYSIASKYNTTVDELKKANNLVTNSLMVGQQLIIPSVTPPVPPANVYTVKSGDSLWSISQKYGVSVDALKKANNLTTTTLSLGQQLTIPPKTTTPTGVTHTVKSGESLYSIAKQYGVSVDDIKNTNNLTSNLLSIGQELIIPGQKTYNTYTVKSGDNLYSIATTYNTTVENLKTINNLSSTALSIGQQLLVP